ncbi:MAG: hypothetical protein CML58_00710 [Rhodobacteraceae bacterium]|jgi:hypothetical protein|nr:hypothetical protein [Paracoccaceae bacterium]MDB2535115.1 SPOR domain-containing protein [Gammaproteobacteria bacterium]|tara:strand:+ start:690 stop:1223 length:534 start_codon:yes stop_codon:yes gene_type:complete
MRDYAKRNSSKRNNIRAKKTVFRSKKKNISVISDKLLLGLLLMSATLAAVSFMYFDTDIDVIEPRKNLNNITIDFPTSLIKNSILIESSQKESFMSCEYFVQIGAYGNKKYALEAKEILNEINLISINEIYSAANPGKLLHSVLSGPYDNRSAANNAKEQITKSGFDPRLRTLCKKN